MARAFSKFLSRNNIFLLILSAFSLGFYLFASADLYRLGFPLDDAWIHQTYARNLAYYGEWAFIHGLPSAGSTAPLWSALLAFGFLIRANYWWTIFLGTTSLWLIAVMGENAARQAVKSYKTSRPYVGIFLCLEWHLVWAAGSGMETLLHAALILFILSEVLANSNRYVLLGFLIGVSLWVRPDGVLLIAPVFFPFLFQRDNLLKLSKQFMFGFLPPLILYIYFNYYIGGSYLPNTFFAKQAEYAIYLEQSVIIRFIKEFGLPLVGAGAMLLPGFIALTVNSIRTRDWYRLAVVLWFLGYIGLYALRLPVTYQHGRYIMPAMPIFFLIGLIGTLEFRWGKYFIKYKNQISGVWVLSTALILFGFWLLGSRSFANDVAFIESEMVDTATWVAENIPPEEIIAAHDIGALGFYGGRKTLIDLAGLISPQVIPFIRDEPRLIAFLDAEDVRYLIIFPRWYATFPVGKEAVFSSNGKFAPALGGENMFVYRWRP